jgi:hypothetical protein
MTEPEPGTGPRPIADVIKELLERAHAEAAPGPDEPVSFFVLEHGGVPQGIGGPYRAEPETDPEADLGHEYDGPELQPGTPEYEAEHAAYQAWAGDLGWPFTDAEVEAGPEAEPEAEP